MKILLKNGLVLVGLFCLFYGNIYLFALSPLRTQQPAYMILEQTRTVEALSSGITATHRIIFSILESGSFEYRFVNDERHGFVSSFSVNTVRREDRKFITTPLSESSIETVYEEKTRVLTKRITIPTIQRGAIIDLTYTISKHGTMYTDHHVFSGNVPIQNDTLIITHSSEYDMTDRFSNAITHKKTSAFGLVTHTYTSQNIVKSVHERQSRDEYRYPTVFFSLHPTGRDPFVSIFHDIDTITHEIQHHIPACIYDFKEYFPEQQQLREHLLKRIAMYTECEASIPPLFYFSQNYRMQDTNDTARALMFLAACKRAGISAEPVIVGPHRSESEKDVFQPSESNALAVRSQVGEKIHMYIPLSEGSLLPFSQRLYRDSHGFACVTPEIKKSSHSYTVRIQKNGTGAILRYNYFTQSEEKSPIEVYTQGAYHSFFLPYQDIPGLEDVFHSLENAFYAPLYSERITVSFSIDIHKNFEVIAIPKTFAYENASYKIERTVTPVDRKILVDLVVDIRERKMSAADYEVLRKEMCSFFSLEGKTIILRERPKRNKFLGIF